VSAGVATAVLKIDVDTHDGMRDGVPTLLDTLRAARRRATFFLSFGPDNAGKAVLNVVRQRGFLQKMLATRAPSLYGWRTILSGTLLPARPVATAFPDLVRRITDEGHEVGVHAWDHRRWQDHLEELDEAAVRGELARAFEAFERILARPPRAVAAPAWLASATSLRVQDGLGLLYASDMRGGPPCFPRLDGYRSTTLQIPTTQPCLEELLTLGRGPAAGCVDEVLRQPEGERGARVLALHAEVEGGRHNDFLQQLLRLLADEAADVITLEELAGRIRASGQPIPVVEATLARLPGRGGRVFVPAVLAGQHA
jgi:peptidoglycan/xylan/chitin deacetylase (PgdA/CDA1 family)